MQSRSRVSEMLTRSFKPQKCKTSLKLAVSRIKLLKNKREVLVKQMRRDLAQLLETGQEQTARIRVEHVIREQKTMSAYELIEIYCEIIDSRLPIIESQKTCPIDLKEAISSVIFASPRCADIPELMDIRKHLTAKYGKDFAKAALELRPESGVSRMMVEKLSANAPDIQTKVNVMTEIAKEHDIKWESKAFEEQVQKPKDDLLSGPSSFSSLDKMEIKSFNEKPSFVRGQNSETTTSVSPYNTTSQPQVKSTLAEEENVHDSNWKLEFEDATSAAEAAAESAERASMAARAAAELVRRGNVSSPSSGNAPSAYVLKNEGSQSTKSKYQDRNYTSRLETSEDTNRKGSKFVKPRTQDVQKDDLVRTNKLTEDETSNNNLDGREQPMSEKTQFIGSAVHPVSGNNFRQDDTKPHHYAQGSLSDIRSASNSDADDSDNAEGNDDSITDYDQGHGTYPFSIHSNIFKENKTTDYVEDQTEAHSFTVHFDDYDDQSRHNERNLLDSFLPQQRGSPSPSLNTDSWRNKESATGFLNNEFISSHSFIEPQQTDYSEKIEKADFQEDSDGKLPPKYDSPKYDSGSENEIEMEKANAGVQNNEIRSSHSFSEQHQSDHSENIRKAGPQSDSDDNLHPKYDSPRYDSPSESEDEMEKVNLLERRGSSNFVDADNSAGRGPLPAQPSHRTSSMDDAMIFDEVRGSTEEESEDVTASNQGYESGVLNFGRLSGGLRNKGYTGPSHLQKSNADVLSRTKLNSYDTSLNNNEETNVSAAVFSADIEEKQSKDLHTNASRIKIRASTANTDTSLGSDGRLADGSSRSVYSEYGTEDLGSPVHESNLQQQEGKELSKAFLRTSATNPSVDSNTEQIYATGTRQSRDSVRTFRNQKLNMQIKTPSESEVSEEGLDSQKAHVRPYNALSSRKPISNSNFDDSETDNLGSQTASVIGDRNAIKFSRRTRPAAQVKEDKAPTILNPARESQAFQLKSATGSSFAKIKHSEDFEGTERSQHRQPYSLTQEAPVKHLLTEPSTISESLKLSQDKSRQSSVKEKNEKSTTTNSYSKATSREPSAKHLPTEPSAVRESPRLSQDKSRHPPVEENNEKSTATNSSSTSISRENSSKNSSHVHPNLPDYDSIAAHFQSLRANVRK
ncbi:microtubule-associated protein futsch-like isoform X2 [Zingiber officinale]|uniref:microtubule-associated protein futsch-like isoform X2 n=1 Tax=Zingiber officinale TaxID=94328 RepID=UPI001C4B7414|nr:microtubule-associated protein futsch-like isoform X2 [Zingiber officinale]